MKLVEIDLSFVEGLKTIKWFENIGKPYDKSVLYPLDDKAVSYLKKSGKELSGICVESICTYEEFVSHINDVDWADHILGWQNELSESLDANFHSEYQKWNEVARISGEYVDSQLKPVLGLDWLDAKDATQVWTEIRISILSLMIENAYRKCRKEKYFKHILLAVYRAGHIPCGWVGGKFPDGKLLVY